MRNILYDAFIAPHHDNGRTFLVCDDGSKISYRAFVKRVAQLAHVLKDNGVVPGDRVVVQAPKVSDIIALYGASLQVGAVYLPLNTAYTETELSYFIADATPRLIVCDSKDEAGIGKINNSVGASLLSLNAQGTGSLSVRADTKPEIFETVARGSEDLAALLYTSGTTGRSKGAMLSHKNLLSNAQALTDLWQITAQDRLVHSLPIFHTHGLFVAMNTSLLAGSMVRFLSGFRVDDILNEIPSATMLMGLLCGHLIHSRKAVLIKR